MVCTTMVLTTRKPALIHATATAPWLGANQKKAIAINGAATRSTIRKTLGLVNMRKFRDNGKMVAATSVAGSRI